MSKVPIGLDYTRYKVVGFSDLERGDYFRFPSELWEVQGSKYIGTQCQGLWLVIDKDSTITYECILDYDGVVTNKTYSRYLTSYTSYKIKLFIIAEYHCMNCSNLFLEMDYLCPKCVSELGYSA